MPRAKSPADDAATQPAEGAENATGRWKYTGPCRRIYTPIPVTVDPGDVVEWPTIPAADGCWEPTPDDVTRMPDNHTPTEG